MDLYIKKVLRVSVAQICQTIGYNAIQSIPLELLIDNLHKFLQEFARDLHRHVELFNRTEANLDDVAISLNNLNISVNDLLDYFYHVQPVSCVIEIPQLPAQKTSNLNFLKPGSKEVLTRPVHIYEYLPPILRDNDEIDEKSNTVIVSSSPNSGATTSGTINYNNENVDEVVKSTGDQPTDSSETFNPGIVAFENPINTKRKFTLDSAVTSTISALTSSATREISSVMMTSGGFISPAIEGRMPEFIIPDIVEKYFGMDEPPPISSTSVAVNPQTSIEKPLNTSSTPNISYTSSLFHSSIKNEASSVSPLVHKSNQGVDKKQVKKVKKKPVNLITTTNMPTPSSSILSDKAQRKRIKMLQKSMAKNNNNAFNGTFKIKNSNGNSMSQGSQEKYLKKQYKIKQKQSRHQYFQKKMEVFESVSIKNQNILPSGKRIPGHIYLPTTDTGSSIKQKKDGLPSSEHTESNQLTNLVETETSTALSASTSHFSSKGIGHHSLSQDNRSDLTPAQLTHPTQDLTSSQCDEVKLNNEPDRSKLNIFKKISSSGRKDRLELSAVAASAHSTAPSTIVPSNADLASVSSSNTTIFGDDHVISLPSGTTITPAPPSGSGRHVYAPPPTSKPGDFDSIISVDDDPSIPESSAVLMQRGDLMIHKPKKRGRKPGSKNQPKLLGLTNKKAKKLKKSFFGHHSNSNLLEPLNLSHSSIANIANIPLGIASTFPIDSESVIKFKKDRRKSKLGKDTNSIRSSVKSPIGKNLVPTKEEFASINQKLMLMDTVLQAAPSSSAINNTLVNKGVRTNSPSFGIINSFSIDSNLTVKAKKEKKKVKQSKEDKQILQQGMHSLLNASQPNKISSNLACKRKSPLSYTSPNFPTVPGMGNIPMFPFYTLPARPGLIPSHNLFSQLPNMHNNPLFMPPLMGFRPLNPSVQSSFKPEKELTPPPLHIGEGNYSKVAPLVPDTMKLELSPAGYPSTSSPNAVKPKTSIITTVSSTKNEQPPGQILTQESNITQSIPSTPGNSLHFNDLKKKFDDLNSPSTSTNNTNVFHNLDVTIEVSSDDSVQGGPQYKSPSLSNRILPSALGTSSSTFNRQSVSLNDLLPGDDVIGKSPDSSTDRINKEHKKNKKLKQNKKQSNLTGTSVFENARILESSVGVSGDFDEEACVLKGFIAESGKRNDNPTHSSNYGSFELSMCTERKRDHKKMKKLLKEGKLKKKKDKKDKNKNKERSEKLLKNEKTEKRKEDKKDKTKKLKKEKKKEKQRTDFEATKVKCSSSGEGTASFLDSTSVVPKLTLKLGQSSQSPIPPETNEVRKAGLKSSLTSFISTGGNKLGSSLTCVPLREPSPELARISPLVTRPPKQKSAVDEPIPPSNLSVGNLGGVCNASGTAQHTTLHQIPSLSASLNIHIDSVIDVDSNSGGSVTSMLPASATILGHGGTNTSSESASNNLTLCNASTVAAQNEIYQSNPQQMIHQHSSSIKHSAAVPLISETNRPSSYIDAEGNRVWICPACGKVDDGSAMIGCDGCDAWYHWVCVGIFVAPNDNEDWFCRVCIAKKRGMHAGDRKRKRSKKKV